MRFHSIPNSSIVVLEPVKEHFEALEKRFQDYAKIIILNISDSKSNQSFIVYIKGQTSSSFEVSGGPEKVYLTDISELLNELTNVGILEVNTMS